MNEIKPITHPPLASAYIHAAGHFRRRTCPLGVRWVPFRSGGPPKGRSGRAAKIATGRLWPCPQGRSFGSNPLVPFLVFILVVVIIMFFNEMRWFDLSDDEAG